MDMTGPAAQKKGTYDIAVIGGGIAGVSAAVSAARRGCSVLLIEKSVNLGGLATNGLISWYEPLCDGMGKQMVFGIAEELIKLAAKYCFDTLHKCWGGSNDGASGKRYATRFSPTVFSLALDEFILENNVNIRFDTYATYPVMDGRHCRGVICESAGGREFFAAKVVIDATGDASISERAGLPVSAGENFMTYLVHFLDRSAYRSEKNTNDIRQWFGMGSDLEGNGHPKGMKKFRGDSADELTEYVVYGKSKILEMLKEKDKNSFDVMTLPSMAQMRTIKRIIGKTDFTATDGLEYPDAIGSCGDFRSDGVGKHYQIPYGALYSPGFDNILACGRIISAPAGDGWEVARVIPNCALTGEASGRAAAEAADKHIAVYDVDTKSVFDLRP